MTGDSPPSTDRSGTAEYVFSVTFRLDPSDASVSPNRFETTMRIPAAEPGTDGWLFFRDRLWRGKLGDSTQFREVASDRLGVEVVSVEFRELRVDPAYFETLRSSIAVDLSLFKAENVDEVLHKYLGSSIHVRE